MEIQLTGNYDTDLKILSVLDDAQVLNLCQASKYSRELCNDDFWKRRFINRYGLEKLENKPENMSYKDYYLENRLSCRDFLEPGPITFKQRISLAVMEWDLEYLDLVLTISRENNDYIAKEIVEDYINTDLMYQHPPIHWLIDRDDILDEIKNGDIIMKALQTAAERGDIDVFLKILAKVENEIDDLELWFLVSKLAESILERKLYYEEVDTYLEKDLNLLIDMGLIHPEEIMHLIMNVDDDLSNPDIKALWDSYIEAGYTIDPISE